MKNFILEYPFFYRLYQSSVRKKKHEYFFFKYIFSKLSNQINIRMLDICSGDSHVLNYVSEYLSDYVGVDLNNKYLKNLEKKWPKYNFLNLDVTQKETIEILKKYNPNFIFMNGAIHHLNDSTMNLINILINNFGKASFLSVDPVYYKNKFINYLMIKNDRGKFIRNPNQYNEIMKEYNSIIIDDFYLMSFKNIFHYKKLDLEKLYKNWKNL